MKELNKFRNFLTEEVNISNEIDEMVKTLAVHMSAEEILEELIENELPYIEHGTKVLHIALKNILLDYNLERT